MASKRPASLAWAGLIVYVVLIDSYLIAQETRGKEGYCTMSTAFKDALRHPIKRLPLLAAWAILTLHLFPILYPERYHKYEPITLAGRYISGTRRAGRRASRQGA